LALSFDFETIIIHTQNRNIMKSNILFAVAILLTSTASAQEVSVKTSQSASAKASTPAVNAGADLKSSTNIKSSTKATSEDFSAGSNATLNVEKKVVPIAKTEAQANISEVKAASGAKVKAATQAGINSTSKSAAKLSNQSVAAVNAVPAVKPSVKVKSLTSNKIKTKPVSLNTKTNAVGQLKIR
jgi:hypothetical protein